MRIAVLVGVILVSPVALAQFQLPKGEQEVNDASEMIVRGDYAAAEPLLRRAVVDAASDPYAHANLAAVLRNTDRYDEAIVEYHKAKTLFERGPSANGEADVSSCLFGIALTEESRGEPQAAARAWADYVRFAQRFEREQPAVAIARSHAQTDEREAHLRQPALGPQKASRPSTTR
jgi:Flp pilus assembly protein TadD